MVRIFNSSNPEMFAAATSKLQRKHGHKVETSLRVVVILGGCLSSQNVGECVAIRLVQLIEDVIQLHAYANFFEEFPSEAITGTELPEHIIIQHAVAVRSVVQELFSNILRDE